jgi:hypothetical protein
VNVESAERLHLISSIDDRPECLVSHLLVQDSTGMAPEFLVDLKGNVSFEQNGETLSLGKIDLTSPNCPNDNGKVVDFFLTFDAGNSVYYSGTSSDTRCYKREGKWRRESVEMLTFVTAKTGTQFSFSGFSDDVFWDRVNCDTSEKQKSRKTETVQVGKP